MTALYILYGLFLVVLLLKCLFMPDYQVVAIFKSIRNRKKKQKNTASPGFEQLSFNLGSLM